MLVVVTGVGLVGEDVLVAKGFRPVDRDQQFLLAPDMREWLGADDPVWLVISVVERLDTSVLRARRRVGGVGRAGYDPDMLLTLLVWAWAQGQRSSRVIERLCSRDIAFRVICAGDVPDHSTISRFRAEAAEAVEDLFAQVLRLCAGWGMGELGVVALDGVKIASNASISANRGEQGLRKAAAEQGVRDAAAAAARRAAVEHAATDAAEDELYGAGCRGGHVPADLVEPSSRARRIDQALAELAAENARRAREQADKQAVTERKQARRDKKAAERAAQLEAFEQRRRPGRPVTGSPPAEIRVQVLTRNWEAARAAQQAKLDRHAQRGTRKGRRPAAADDHAMVKRARAALDRAITAQATRAGHHAAIPTAPAETEAVKAKSWAGTPTRNITDPQSRLMPLRGGGWLQGYNCQAVTSTDGLIIATGVGNNPSDATTFTSMLDKATAAAQLITGARAQTTHAPTGPDRIGVLLADAGYLTHANLTHPGPDRLIATGKTRTQHDTARDHPAHGPAPTDATALEANAHRLRTPEGHALYKQRAHIAETPFGHAKHNLGFRRFTSRGIRRATAEFAFHALVHNLLKAINTGHLTPTTS